MSELTPFGLALRSQIVVVIMTTSQSVGPISGVRFPRASIRTWRLSASPQLKLDAAGIAASNVQDRRFRIALN